jgi:hypothetical protein
MTRRSQKNQGTKAEIKQKQKQKKEKQKQKEKQKKEKQKKEKRGKEKRDKSIPLTKVINAPLMLTEVIINAALHDLGYYLDRYGFAALETVSPSMQENVQAIIRARNQKLPVGKRMANLAGQFIVWKVCKRLFQLEGLYPLYIIATGGRMNVQNTTTVMSLDLVTKRYRTLVPMITARYRHAFVVHDGKLYVMGGYNFSTSLSSVECFDFETGQWSEVKPMTTPRFGHGAAVLGGKIYVAGGCSVQSLYPGMSEVECFDPATNQWTAVTPMNTPRSDHRLVSAKGMLFAVGGINPERQALSNVECFNPLTWEWSNITALNHARYELVVAALGDKLYAIGGGGDSQGFTHGKVECLDLSDPNNEWTTMAPMISDWYCVGAVVTGGKIYVVGENIFGTKKIICCFDPIAEQWSIVNEAPEFCSSAEFSVC